MAAPTALTVVTLPTPWSVTPAAPTFTTADLTNGNSFGCDGLTFLVVRNTDTVGGHTLIVTIAPVADADTARAGPSIIDTIAIAADATHPTHQVYQLFPINGWRNQSSLIVVTFTGTATTAGIMACRIAAGAGFFGAV